MTESELHTLPAGGDLELAVATRRVEAALFDVAPLVRLGRYVLLQRVGAGAMGIVYAAHDPELDRKVAIKVLRPHGDTNLEQAPARLVREARALGRVAHPNVVAVHDAGTIGAGQVFVAMEFVDGVTLTRWRAEPRSPRDVLDVLLQAGQGLAAAHRAGLVHRDFKPDNVMITSTHGTMRVRVMDFGLARPTLDEDRIPVPDVATEPAGVSTRTGAVVGTPAYMAPEQMTGAAADARSDQFAFCVVAWEALWGTRPFVAPSREALFLAIEERRFTSQSSGGLAGSLHAALRRGLALQPEDRFASMDELLEALARGPKRRRLRIIGVTAVAAAVALSGGALARAALIESRCVDAGREIEGVWSDAERERVEQAMLRSGVPFAASTWARVQPGIDAYADSWATMRAEACRAHDSDDLDDAQLEQAQSCFADGRERLAALLGGLGDPDLAAVRRASDAVFELPDPATCSDARELVARRWSAPPPERSDEIDDARQRLAEVRALSALGRVRPAHEATMALVELADGTDWPTLRVEARLVASATCVEARDLDAALAHAEAALDIAARVGDDGGVADALLALVDVARDRSEYERAEALTEVASALVHRVEPDPGLRSARVESLTGSVALAVGRYDDAVEALERAQSIANDVVAPEHPLHAQLWAHLGSAHFRRSDLVLAADARQRALELWTEQLGPDHPQVGEATAMLGTVHVVAGESSRGQELLERGIRILEHALGPDDENLATPLINLSLYRAQVGHPRLALPMMQRALRIRERVLGPEHHDVAHANVALANVELTVGDFEGALRHAEAALAVRERLFGAEHVEVAQVLDVVGAAHQDRGELDKALVAFERARDIRERRQPGTIDHAKSLADLATVRLALGDLGEAELLDRRVLEIYAARGLTGANAAITQVRLAEVARRRGELDAAQDLLTRARAALREAGEYAPDNVLLEEGMLAAARGRWSDAIVLHRTLLAQVLLEVGLDTPRGVNVRLALAEDLIATGEIDEARQHAEDALAVIERGGGPYGTRERARAVLAHGRSPSTSAR